MSEFENWIKNLFFVMTSSFVTYTIMVFMKAYTGGGRVLIDVNYYGEMRFEAALIIMYLIILLPRTILYFKEGHKE